MSEKIVQVNKSKAIFTHNADDRRAHQHAQTRLHHALCHLSGGPTWLAEQAVDVLPRHSQLLLAGRHHVERQTAARKVVLCGDAGARHGSNLPQVAVDDVELIARQRDGDAVVLRAQLLVADRHQASVAAGAARPAPAKQYVAG